MKGNSIKMAKQTKQTSKKVKVVGTQQYINATDGTVEDFQVMRIEERDFNFHKIWLEHIVNSLDLIGNQKTRLAFWIIEHLDKENKLTMTYRQIAEKSGISLDTVRVTMKSLMDSNFIERINQGAYRVNPDVIFKGGKTDRMNVLYQYQNVKKNENINDSEKNCSECN